MEFYEEERFYLNEVERHKENSARLAMANTKYSTTGQGSIQFRKRFDFGLTFIEEPWMNYGAYIDVDELADRLNIDSGINDPCPLPLSTGFVTEWDRDERDFYIGAWMGVRVWFPESVSPAAEIQITVAGAMDIAIPIGIQADMHHYFTFSGIAIKDVPLEGASKDD